jgi:hypothetical protein
MSNNLPCISNRLPPPPTVVIPTPYPPRDNGPVVDRSAFHAEYGLPNQITMEEDDCDSAPSDDNDDSDYIEDVETEVVDSEEQLPPSKRRKRNQQVDTDLAEGLDQSPPSVRSLSQRDHSPEPASDRIQSGERTNSSPRVPHTTELWIGCDLLFEIFVYKDGSLTNERLNSQRGPISTDALGGVVQIVRPI